MPEPCFKTKNAVLSAMVLSLAVIAIIHAARTGEAAPLPPPDEEKPASVDVNKIGAGDEGIGINVKGRNLQQVLQVIQRLSGIRFEIASSLKNELVTASFQAPNWTTAVHKLLKDFNRIEVWNRKKQLTLVRLLNREERRTLEERGPHPPEAKPEQAQGRVKSKRNPTGKPLPEIILSTDQLLELAETPPGTPMPSHLFHSMDFRHFLRLYGIESPEDWVDSQKAKTVRKWIGKHLLQKRTQKRKAE
ncbi:MAG: hypothetical protein ACE5GQ_04965 [Nitrospinales bacterium]